MKKDNQTTEKEEKFAPKKGDEIEFTAARIQIGNPVTGTLTNDWKDDDEWVSVTLTKRIEGLVNIWLAGEMRSFRKSFLSHLKIIKKHA